MRRDPDDPFRTDAVRADLAGRSVRGIAAALATTGGRVGVSFVGLVVLARLLEPRDFGVIAAVVAVTGFVTMLKDLGLGVAAMQREGLTERQGSALFWVNLAAGAVVALLVAGLAPVVGWIYSNGELVGVTLAMAGLPVLAGLTVQHRWLLQRQMRFVASGVIGLTALGGGLAVAIALAAGGAGYWALIGQMYAAAAIDIVGVWLWTGWRPGGPGSVRRGLGLRELVRFGGYLTGFNVLNYIVRHVDDLLLGRRWGEAALGQYSRGYALMRLPSATLRSAFESVATPGLSRLQDDPVRFRRYLVLAWSALTLTAGPVAAFGVVEPERLAAVILGPGWERAGEAFVWLAAAGLSEVFTGAVGWVYVATGRMRRFFWQAVPWTLLVLVAFAIGIDGGVVGVAKWYTIAMLIWMTPNLIICFTGTAVRPTDVVAATWRAAVAIAAAAAATVGLRYALADVTGGWSDLAAVGLHGAIFAAVYLLVVVGLPGGRALLREMWGRGGLLFSKQITGGEEADSA